MISYFSGSIAWPCARTILSAPSMASVPELQKKTRCRPLISAELLRQRSLVLVIVEIGGVDQQRGLLADHLDDARMRVAQRVHADAGDKIQ